MKKYFLIIFFSIIIACIGYSQTDTIIIIKTDTVFVPEKKDRMYKFFVENRGRETNHLWKINLIDIALANPNVGYEHRLGKSWSVEGYFSFGMTGNIQFDLAGYSILPHIHEVYVFEQQFKYYYNLKRRKKLGKKTYGFSGNYFASSFWYNKINYNGSSGLNWVSNYNVGIKYGMQRRIGNLGYFEIYAGVYYRWESANIELTAMESRTDKSNAVILLIGIKAGFAIDSFDSLRRMLKD